MRNPLFTGPGEAIFAFMVAMLIRATIGFEFLYPLFHWLRATLSTLGIARFPPVHYLLEAKSVTVWIHAFVRVTYHLVYTSCLWEAWHLPRKNSATRNGLLFCLLYRAVPAFLFYFEWVSAPTGPFSVICDGLFLSILTNDVVLGKMSQRDLHPWVVLFAMLSIFDNFVILLLCFVYHLAVMGDLCFFLNLNLFSLNKNVYVDGVYDMCHIGHAMAFKNALTFGNRLFVGVLSDKDVASYKRAPIMKMEERCAVVACQKYVYKVIPNSPFPGIPADFLKKWNIHVVCLSPEYDTPEDKYYKLPREMGITKVLPRTDGMSTSELIARCKVYWEKEQEAKSPKPPPTETTKQEETESKSKDKSKKDKSVKSQSVDQAVRELLSSN